jgi:hypothetical protein
MTTTPQTTTPETHRCSVCGTLRWATDGDCPSLSHGLLSPVVPDDGSYLRSLLAQDEAR